MTTRLLPDRTLEQRTPMGTHWVCVLVDEDPYVGLCGELTNGDRLGPDAHTCRHCLELAPAHGVSCPACAAWVGRVA